MKNPRPPTLPHMNLGSLSNSAVEQVSGIPQADDGRHPLTKLKEDLVVAQMNGPKDDEVLPIIETSRECIEFYHRSPEKMKSFDYAGYFILDNVIVCENGKTEDVKAKMSTTSDELKYGKKIT